MPTQLRRIARSGFSALLWCLCVAVVVENIALLRQNRIIKQRLEEEATAAPVASDLREVAGVSLERTLTIASNLSNRSITKFVIVTFSPGCPACLANQAGWTQLFSQIHSRSEYRMLWVSRDPVEITSDYCNRNGIPRVDVLADPPYRTFVQLGLRVVPKTIIVNSEGQVERIWAGKLGPAEWKILFRYVGVEFNASQPHVEIVR